MKIRDCQTSETAALTVREAYEELGIIQRHYIKELPATEALHPGPDIETAILLSWLPSIKHIYLNADEEIIILFSKKEKSGIHSEIILRKDDRRHMYCIMRELIRRNTVL